tara:strand:+ start:80 stop:286 length:207 start_codon:yes stop_codon:yes gene_type:complete
MSQRTIGSDGNDERFRPVDRPVDYLIVLRASLTAEQAAEFEDCEEVILRHPTKPALIRAQVKSAEVIR